MAGRLQKAPGVQALSGIRMPHRLYFILKDPAPLAGMEYPDMGLPWGSLFAAGLSNVVCLCGDHVSYNPAPLRLLLAVEMEDLHHGGPPGDPAGNERIVRDTVDMVLSRLDRGEGVVVHCVGGTGRTGTVLGCVLRSMGYPAEDIIAHLNELNLSRGKRGWPESPWQAEMIRRF
jgi:protein-tyrosine phosphatase